MLRDQQIFSYLDDVAFCCVVHFADSTSSNTASNLQYSVDFCWKIRREHNEVMPVLITNSDINWWQFS